MQGKFRLHPGLLACALAWGWGTAQATSLGSIEQTAFIGKPFIASIPIGDAPDNLGCVSVQLSYGDAPVSSTFTLRDHILKIRSNSPINEPLLNLNVSADCENTITRSYTLFAEMPAVKAERITSIPSNDSIERERLADAPDSNRANNQNFFGIESSPNTDYIIVQSLPTERQTVSNTPREAKRAAPATETLLASQELTGKTDASSTRTAESPPSKASARLELDNAEILEKDPHLRLAYELLTTSPSTPTVREEARARWLAFSQQMANIEAVKSITASTSTLVLQEKSRDIELRTQHNEAEIAKLQAQLARERNGSDALRYTLYGVLSLLLLGFGALALRRWRGYFLQRNKKRNNKEKAWWQQYGNTGAAPLTSTGMDLPISPAPATNLTGYVQELPVPEVAFDSILSSDFVGLSPATPQHEPAADKGHSPHSKGIEGLQETQEQADFFVALGEYERAENLMRRYIERNPETSPLAYLNLLGIYHAAEKEQAFETLREHFNRTFNAQIPDFIRFKSDPRDLSSYPDTLEQLQASWGRSEAIRFIGELLFRQPHQAKNESAFAPVAYRELLMLYGIATDTTATADDISHIRNITAGAAKWLQQPDTMVLDDGHPSTIIEGEGTDAAAGFAGEFNTGPSPLDKDGWSLDGSAPPEHLGLDLNLDSAPVDLDLQLPDDGYHAAPTTMNLGVEPLDFAKPSYSDSNLDISLSEVDATHLTPLSPQDTSKKKDA